MYQEESNENWPFWGVSLKIKPRCDHSKQKKKKRNCIQSVGVKGQYTCSNFITSLEPELKTSQCYWPSETRLQTSLSTLTDSSYASGKKEPRHEVISSEPHTITNRKMWCSCEALVSCAQSFPFPLHWSAWIPHHLYTCDGLLSTLPPFHWLSFSYWYVPKKQNKSMTYELFHRGIVKIW